MTRTTAFAVACVGLLLLSAASSASAFRNLAPGAPVPDFDVPTLTGEPLRLSEQVGERVTILLFWATWSPRSAEALADLQGLLDRYAAAGLRVLAVNVDTEEWDPGKGAVVASAIARAGVAYPVGLDKDLSVYARFGVAAVPSLVVMDETMTAVEIVEGYSEWGRDVARDRTRKLLASPAPDSQAREALSQASGAGGRTLYYLRMARHHFHRGMSQMALQSLMRAVAEDPRSAEACRELRQTLRALGRDDEASRVESQLASLAGGAAALRPRRRLP